MTEPVNAAAALALLALAGCAIQRAELARTARDQMIGMPKEKVLICMGAPANQATVANTEVWGYNSGNGEQQMAFGNGWGVSEQRFCKVSIVMTSGAVSAVNYSGPTGVLLSAGEQCAYAIANCVKPAS